MGKDSLLFIITALLVGVIACTPPTPSGEYEGSIPQPVENSTGYDADLAQRLGADDYGMRKYVMAFLKKGPNRNQDSLEADRLQRAHLDNISRLAEEGKLALAGPFLDDGDVRGIYIFNVETVEEAQALTNSDPAIQAGRLVMELHPWYGSAAVMQINETHKRVAKEGI